MNLRIKKVGLKIKKVDQLSTYCPLKKVRETIYKHDVSLDSIYTEQSKEYAVLLMGPHPLMGGTMSNSVLRSIEAAFLEKGFSTLRFNFRGVGSSQGTIIDRTSDACDALWVMDQLSQQMQDAKQIWIAGYGYGAYMAIDVAMRRPCAHGFVSVSPHYKKEEGLLNLLTPCPNGVIIHGTSDKVVSCAVVKNLSKSLHPQEGTRISFCPIDGADHLYTDSQDRLKEAVASYLDQFFSAKEAKREKIEAQCQA